ncbi:hypothetical protein ACFPOG_30660 [Paenibacillus aestuarii]|uniref:DUF3139 domain-containing protein n=1 Tax=Paenibacillus aestuarii TaxID=516965 RepID=A0ABW0KH15_9BACL
MKKVLIIILAIFGLFAIGFMAIIWDYIYYPMIKYKAEDKAFLHLKTTYQEDFVIDSVTYEKQFGEHTGSYYITAHPKAHKDIDFSMYVGQDFKVSNDSYKESKWRNDMIQEYAPLIDALSPGFRSYAVNLPIPEGLINKYNIETNYGDIRKQNENNEEYLFMGAAVDAGFNEQQSLEFGYRVAEFMKQRNLKNASIEINFYPKSFLDGLDENNRRMSVFDFRSKFFKDSLPFRISYDSRINKTKTSLTEVKSPEDMKPFLVYTRNK